MQSVLYFLYGTLLVTFLGEELTVIFTYWYLRYLDGGMMSVLPAVVHGSNSIRSYRSTSGRRAVLRMPAYGISALLLDVGIPPCNAPSVTRLTSFSFPSFLTAVFGENGQSQ